MFVLKRIYFLILIKTISVVYLIFTRKKKETENVWIKKLKNFFYSGEIYIFVSEVRIPNYRNSFLDKRHLLEDKCHLFFLCIN